MGGGGELREDSQRGTEEGSESVNLSVEDDQAQHDQSDEDVHVSPQEPLITPVVREDTNIPSPDSEDTIMDDIDDTMEKIVTEGYEKLGEGGVENTERLDSEEIQKNCQGSKIHI